MIRHLAFALAAALIASPAIAHQVDCHGMPVGKAEKMGCCGAGDAHSYLDDTHFKEDDKGVWHFLSGGVDYPVTGGSGPVKPLPSSDGCYTIWYRRNIQGRIQPDPEHDLPPGTSPDDVIFYCLELPLDL
jgi:hypothetical protein